MSEDINEVNALLLDIYSMSLEELNKFIVEGNFVISKSVSYKEITISELPGEWELIHSKPKDDSDDVILFIIPKGPNAQKVWDAGQFKVARAAGLSSRQSRRWVKAKLKFKYDLLPTLVEILKDENLIKAFINYSTELDNKGYREWYKNYSMANYVNHSWFKQNKEKIKQLLLKVIAEVYAQRLTEGYVEVERSVEA